MRENLLHRKIVEKVLVEPEAIDGLDPSLRYENARGETMFSAGLQIAPYGWAIITEEPLSEALLASQRTITIGVLFSVSIAVMLLILMIVIRRLIATNKRANDINAKLDMNAALLLKREQDLMQANGRLRELDQIKSDFLSVAAHQLRTPLSAVHWVNSILLEQHIGALSDEQKSYIMKAEESNNRMIHLIDDMLTITRIESGKIEYHFYTLSLDSILSTMVTDFLPKAKEKGVMLSYNVEPNIVTDVFVDSEKIRYVFENLLENAIRYTPSGGTITMTLTKKEEMFSVVVKDSGIGISEKERKDIFTKFFRAANAVKTVTDGSGLGLFVAKSITLRHGGTIS
ncbi:MAG TPA: HAMP domain-containing sensor histidine kinase, partial [Acidobacteriota bacterium]|nr:HAMP domain-containing sensor histidine kinase [Acidobacteriota bacterium]